jgi:two-component system sensor histidine kinase KdpD
MKIVLIWALFTAIAFVLNSLGWQESTLILAYVLGSIIWTVLKIPYGYGLFLTFVNVLTFNYFFTLPYYTLRVDDFQYLFTFISMFLVSGFTSYIVFISNKNRHMAHIRSLNNRYLFQLSELLYQSLDFEEGLKDAIVLLENTLHAHVEVKIFNHTQQVTEYIEQCESDIQSKVLDAYMTAQPQILDEPIQKSSCFPILINKEVRGFIFVNDVRLSDDAIEWMSTIGSILALAKQRIESIRMEEEAKLNYEQEQLRVSLLSSISHDLRTPLASILGSSTLLMDELKLNEKDNVLITNIQNDAKWLLDSVENILSLIRLNKGNLSSQFQPVMIEDCIEEALKHFSLEDIKRIHLDYQHSMLFVNVEVHLLVKAIVNLVHNALKFSTKEVVIKTYQTNGWCCVEIIDKGIGFSKNIKDYLTDGFQSTKPLNPQHRQGVGLGLHIVSKIIDVHHGQLSIHPNSTQGSIVTIKLAIHQEVL